MNRNSLTLPSVALTVFLFAFFALFLVYPSGLMLKEAFLLDGHFSTRNFELLFHSPLHLESIRNSCLIASLTTVLATAVALPLAWITSRFSFRGKTLLGALLLMPLILPPFVGAIGLKQLFARFGSINLLLEQLGLQSPQHPIDWLGGGGFTGMVLLQTFSLCPILYLNLAAALGGIDPSLHEAATNLGASGWRRFRTITLPLILPGYFAGAILVFIGAFTDLGTPLVFGFSRVVPVQIFDAVSDLRANPMGYALVVLVLLLTLVLFTVGKLAWTGKRYEMFSRGHSGNSEVAATRGQAIGIWLLAGGWGAIAVLPHLGVLLQSFSNHWVMTVAPDQVTTEHYRSLWAHDLTASSIRNSLLYSGCSATLDLFLGVAIAWLLTRRRIPFSGWLDALAMLPLALPGLILAFGYVAGFDGPISWLNPRTNPVFLLIISYSVRRLPYIVRSACAGFEQTSLTLEEAAANLGAGPMRVLRTITLPLIFAHLIAGTVLTFAFAMLEVSDGLILAMKDNFFPITKMIYSLMGRIDANAASIASALGILGMAILGLSLLIANRLLGKKMSQLFRTH